MPAKATPLRIEQGVARIDTLRANPWNTNTMSPDNEAKLDASIKRFGGLYKPVVVRPHADGGLEILGGEHRWESARRLGMIEVPYVNVGPVSDKVAKEIGLADNGRYGEDDTLALSRLLKELGADDVAEFLPYSEGELESILAASSIDIEDLDALDTEMPELATPGVGATHQVMRFKVPVEDVAWVTAAVARAQREQAFTQEDSMTNAGNAFVHLMKAYK
jgi:ParB family chromosome partitioning protein